MRTNSVGGIALAGAIVTWAVLTRCAGTVSRGHEANGLDVYFVRHAETLANVTGMKTPENNRVITDTGLEQIQALTNELSRLNPDVILVSPTYRTMKTVLPHLESTGKVAEIWPELEEWRMEADALTMLATEDDAGQEIRIDTEFGLHFKFRDSESDKRYFARNYAGGIRQTELTARMIIDRFGNSGRSILIVGHSNAGSRLLETLLGLVPDVRFKLEKAEITHLRQFPSGKFKMISLNSLPYTE